MFKSKLILATITFLTVLTAALISFVDKWTWEDEKAYIAKSPYYTYNMEGANLLIKRILDNNRITKQELIEKYHANIIGAPEADGFYKTGLK